MLVTITLFSFHLSLAALGLCCCTRAFSSRSEQWVLFVVVCGLLVAVVSLAVDHRRQELWFVGLASPQHVGSSRPRDGSRVPCIGRQILNH